MRFLENLIWTRPKCPDTVDSRKTHLILFLPGIFCSNLGFWVSLYEIFEKISLAALDLASIH